MFCHPIQRWFNKISWLLITFFDLVSVLKRKRHGGRNVEPSEHQWPMISWFHQCIMDRPHGPSNVHMGQVQHKTGSEPIEPLPSYKILSYLVNGRSGNSSAVGKGTCFELATNPIFGFD